MTTTPNQDDEAKAIISMRSDERGALSSEALAMLQRGADAMVRADEAFEKAWSERRRKTWAEAGREGEPNIDWSEGFKRYFREGWQAALAAQPQTAPQAPEKIAPVQGWPAGIPWSLHLEAYAAYSKKWSPQPALIEGGCRGGFGTEELDEFIPGWRDHASEITALKAEVARLRAALSAAPHPTGGKQE